MRDVNRFRLSAALAAAMLITGCSGKGDDRQAKTETEVRDGMNQIVAAFAGRDADKAVSFDGPDFVGMYHGTPNLYGQEADRAITKQQVADPAMKFSISDEAVEAAQSGDLAVWRATYTYTFTDPATKQVKTELGNWVVMWKRGADGKMKETWSTVADPPPAPPAAAPKP